MKGKIEYIDFKTAGEFLLPKHYSGRLPTMSYAFGWYFRDELKAVCTFGKPTSPAPCKGVCGEQWANNVYELNRLCRTEDLEEPLSQFVSACLRRLRPYNLIIISYSDTGMNHHGYIYQACNFIYTGITAKRLDRYTGEKHARHYALYEDTGLRQVRTQKHRYVYFCTFNSRLKVQWKNDLKWPVCPYPKGDNENYVLGEYQKPIVVDKDGNLCAV